VPSLLEEKRHLEDFHRDIHGELIRLCELRANELDAATSAEELQAAIGALQCNFAKPHASKTSWVHQIWFHLMQFSDVAKDWYIKDAAVEAALRRAQVRLADLQVQQSRKEVRQAAGVELPARPDAHLCKISQEPMSDPVVAADGHTYERRMIEMWLRPNNTSPMTREPLRDNELHPNLNLKNLIDEWEEQARTRALAPKRHAPVVLFVDRLYPSVLSQEHERAMASAMPQPVRQSTADLEAELRRRKGESSGVSAPAPAAGKRKAPASGSGKGKAPRK
jgi:hypothetical protein